MQRQPEGEFSGFVPDFLEALSNVVPFAYKIQAIRHRDYGRRSENGTWSGLMAEVVNKVSDCMRQSSRLPRKSEVPTKPLSRNNTNCGILERSRYRSK